MKRACFLLFFVLLGVVLSGCSGDSDKKLTAEFADHLKSHYENTEDHVQRLVFSSDKLKFIGTNLEIEKVEYGTYRVVATMGDIASNPMDQIWTISAKELKQEMRAFAEVFISFAKEKKLDNDYYLYIQIYDSPLVSFVYDYEKDTLYVPEKHEQYREMYAKFGTTNKQTILQIEGGKQWLVQNGFGEIKHHEYESVWVNSPSVFLNEEGKIVECFLLWKFEE